MAAVYLETNQNLTNVIDDPSLTVLIDVPAP
jgi:hypothetical protein